jgi:hypothetical protein
MPSLIQRLLNQGEWYGKGVFTEQLRIAYKILVHNHEGNWPLAIHNVDEGFKAWNWIELTQNWVRLLAFVNFKMSHGPQKQPLSNYCLLKEHPVRRIQVHNYIFFSNLRSSHLLRIREVPGSNMGPEIYYSDRCFLVNFSPSRQISGYDLKLVYWCLRQIIFIVGFLAATRSGRVKVAQADVLLTVKKTSVQYDIINDLPLLTVNYSVKPIVPVLSVADESPHAVLWASGRRIGTEQMFPDRRVQKPSVPTVLDTRLSSGYESFRSDRSRHSSLVWLRIYLARTISLPFISFPIHLN